MYVTGEQAVIITLGMLVAFGIIMLIILYIQESQKKVKPHHH